MFDWAAEYAKAAPGPLHPCDPSLLQPGESAGTPPQFDNNTTYSGAASTAKIDLTPGTTSASSYICRARAGDGSIGEISWDGPNKKLTVSGVIFFDATFDQTKTSTVTLPIHYYGKGTIFFSNPGQGVFNGEKWCAGGTLGVDCTASPAATNMPNWDPSANALWLAGGDKCTGSCTTDWNFADGAFQGALYSLHECHLHGGGFLLAGPLICGQIDVDGSGTAAFTFPPVNLLETTGTASIDLQLGPQSG
jgi:hypothetical protein